MLPRAGRQTVGQLRASLSRAVLAVDPAAAEARHERAVAGREVRVRPLRDGMAELWALLPADSAVAVYSRVDRLARCAPAGDPRGMDARRADALVAAVLAPATAPTALTAPDACGETRGAGRSRRGRDSHARRWSVRPRPLSRRRRTVLLCPPLPGPWRRRRWAGGRRDRARDRARRHRAGSGRGAGRARRIRSGAGVDGPSAGPHRPVAEGDHRPGDGSGDRTSAGTPTPRRPPSPTWSAPGTAPAASPAAANPRAAATSIIWSDGRRDPPRRPTWRRCAGTTTGSSTRHSGRSGPARAPTCCGRPRPATAMSPHPRPERGC